MSKKKIVILSGAGMSAESGLHTFRDSGGLWEKYRIEDVATPEAWAKNPDLVLKFYNARHAQLINVVPNAAHIALVALESKYDVEIITQNVDDLHERAGSSNILHLHGSLTTCRSSGNQNYIQPMPNGGLNLGDFCPDGHQLRPNIVWFGEMVPNIELAVPKVAEADILIIIGTSLNVYPAAGLVTYARPGTQTILIDPAEVAVHTGITYIKKPATQALPALFDILGITPSPKDS